MVLASVEPIRPMFWIRCFIYWFSSASKKIRRLIFQRARKRIVKKKKKKKSKKPYRKQWKIFHEPEVS